MIIGSGCIVCRREGWGNVPCTWHHMDGQKSQEKHKLTIGLCTRHHDGDQKFPKSPLYTSRHPNKFRFEERYGTELELLAYQNELLADYGVTHE